MSTLTLSVLLNGDRVLQLPPIAPAVDVATIKMLIEAETGISAGSLVLLHAQRVLTDAQTLAALGVADHSMLEARSGAAARPAAPVPAAASAATAVASAPAGRSSNRLGIPDAIMGNPAAARAFILQQPALLFQIESQNPPLARALHGADIEPFATLWKQIVDNLEAERREEAERFRLANADPMDPEVQARIEEQIRLKNVQENWEMAIEHNPEAFGRVIMLYVPMKVNGHALQAFVDSGAQSTIMSVQCAERCGIMRLLDRRYAGIAKGVGSAKILGRVHQVPCVIGNAHVSMSFTILENQNMSFLLGLDQLKNHQACIDLQKNALRIAGEEVPFLAEHAIQEGKDEEEEEGEGSPAASASASASGAARAPAGSASAAASSSSAAAAAASSAKPAAASQPQPTHLTTSGHNVARPTAGVPSSQGSVATAAHRPAGALSASVPPPDQSPNPPAAANAAAVVAAQRRAAEAISAVAGGAPAPAAAAVQQPTSVATPAAVATAPRAGAAGGAAALSESAIEQLVQLGFSRAESIQALTVCNGNAELAAGYLFNM